MPRKGSAQSDVKVSASEDAELAVKAYLATIGKPKPRGRQARPKPDFEAATKGISDPLAKLAAIKAERERVANAVIGNPTEEAFIQYGKTWARIHDYTRDDFAALGVQKRVLDATFGAGTGAPKAAVVPPARAGRVDTEQLADAIAAKPAGTWVTVAGVMREVGGSQATVRKVLDRLSAQGTLTLPFDDPKHAARGRAPKVWDATERLHASDSRRRESRSPREGRIDTPSNSFLVRGCENGFAKNGRGYTARRVRGAAPPHGALGLPAAPVRERRGSPPGLDVPPGLTLPFVRIPCPYGSPARSR
jgi:hypothetical protein